MRSWRLGVTGGVASSSQEEEPPVEGMSWEQIESHVGKEDTSVVPCATGCVSRDSVCPERSLARGITLEAEWAIKRKSFLSGRGKSHLPRTAPSLKRGRNTPLKGKTQKTNLKFPYGLKN